MQSVQQPQAIQQNSNFTFAKCARVWSYGGKVVIVARNILFAASRNCNISILAKVCPCHLKKTVTYLKFFSIVGVPFDIADLKGVAQKTFKDWQTGEKKVDVALGLLIVTVIAVGIFDSITTFVNAVLSVNKSPEVLSWASLPCAFFMVGGGTVNRSVQILRAYHKRNVETNEKRELQRKMAFDTIALMTNGIVLAALELYRRKDSTPIPPLLVAAAFSIRLAAQYYQNRSV
jgi:hypothetical protein